MFVYVFIMVYFGTSALCCTYLTHLCRINPPWFQKTEIDKRLVVMDRFFIDSNWKKATHNVRRMVLWNIVFVYLFCHYVLSTYYFIPLEVHMQSVHSSVSIDLSQTSSVVLFVQNVLLYFYFIIAAFIIRFGMYWIIHQSFHRLEELFPCLQNDLFMNSTVIHRAMKVCVRYWQRIHQTHHEYGSTLPITSVYYHPIDFFVLHSLPLLLSSRLVFMNIYVSALWFFCNSILQVLLHSGHLLAGPLNIFISKHDQNHQHPELCRDICCL